MSSKESLGDQVGQEELPWDPYANLAVAEEAEGEEKDAKLSAESNVRTVRRQEQALGVAAIAGVLGSGETAVPNDDVEETYEPGEEVDTVVVRARQSLGDGRFEGLVDTMMDSAEEDEPRVTMEKFRESTEATLMDAGELWQAVVTQSKHERFPELKEYREEGKFYVALGLEELQKALDTGKLERTDDGGNGLKSDLSLSGDRLGDGRWKSGFEEGKAVTLILDGSLIDKPDFMALKFRPTCDEIDLSEYCLGAVSDFRTGMGRRVQRMIRKSELATIPVYQEYDDEGELVWATTVYPASALREQASEYAKNVKAYETVKAAVYEGVDRNGLEQGVEERARGFDRGKLGEILLEYGKPRTDEEKADIERALVEYYAEGLVLREVPELVRRSEPKKRWLAKYQNGGEKSEIVVNTARLDETNVRLLMKAIGIEMWRMRQEELVKALNEGAEALGEDERSHAELLRKNLQGEIKATDDIYQSRKQYREVDAQLFGETCVRAYDEAMGEINKMTNRIKRGAEKIKKGAETLMDKVGAANG